MVTMAPAYRAVVEAALNPDAPAPGAPDATLDEYAARVEGNAVVAGAAEAAGLTPRRHRPLR